MSTYSKKFLGDKIQIRAFVKIDGKTNWISVQKVDSENNLVYLGIDRIAFKISDVIEWGHL